MKGVQEAAVEMKKGDEEWEWMKERGEVKWGKVKKSDGSAWREKVRKLSFKWMSCLKCMNSWPFFHVRVLKTGCQCTVCYLGRKFKSDSHMRFHWHVVSSWENHFQRQFSVHSLRLFVQWKTWCFRQTLTAQERCDAAGSTSVLPGANRVRRWSGDERCEEVLLKEWGKRKGWLRERESDCERERAETHTWGEN